MDDIRVKAMEDVMARELARMRLEELDRELGLATGRGILTRDDERNITRIERERKHWTNKLSGS